MTEASVTKLATGIWRVLLGRTVVYGREQPEMKHKILIPLNH